MNIPAHSTAVDAWAAHTLANDAMRLEVVPALGGKIASLQCVRTGREWLWRNPHLPLRRPEPGGDYVGAFDSGGWDELLPTVAPCTAAATPWGDRTLTDHGELWCRPWVAERDGAALRMTLDDPALPMVFERTLRLASGDGALTLDYALTNRGDEALPYIWAAHPLIAIEPGMRIELPADARARCTAAVGLDALVLDRGFDWPNAPLTNDDSLRLDVVPERAEAGYAVKLFTESRANPWVAVHDPANDARLRLTVQSDRRHHIGLWLNYGGWSGGGSPPYFNVGVEPTTTPGERLDDSITAGGAAMVRAGATRHWSVQVDSNLSRGDTP